MGHVPFSACAHPVCAELPVHPPGTDLVLGMMYPIQDLQALEFQTSLHGPQKMEWTHLPEKEALWRREKTRNNRISFSMLSGADTFHVLFGWSRNRFFRGSDGFQHTLEANVSQGSLAVVLVDNSVWKSRWVFLCRSLSKYDLQIMTHYLSMLWRVWEIFGITSTPYSLANFMTSLSLLWLYGSVSTSKVNRVIFHFSKSFGRTSVGGPLTTNSLKVQ